MSGQPLSDRYDHAVYPPLSAMGENLFLSRNWMFYPQVYRVVSIEASSHRRFGCGEAFPAIGIIFQPHRTFPFRFSIDLPLRSFVAVSAVHLHIRLSGIPATAGFLGSGEYLLPILAHILQIHQGPQLFLVTLSPRTTPTSLGESYASNHVAPHSIMSRHLPRAACTHPQLGFLSQIGTWPSVFISTEFDFILAPAAKILPQAYSSISRASFFSPPFFPMLWILPRLASITPIKTQTCLKNGKTSTRAIHVPVIAYLKFRVFFGTILFSIDDAAKYIACPLPPFTMPPREDPVRDFLSNADKIMREARLVVEALPNAELFAAERSLRQLRGIHVVLASLL
ncbi:hypothetical protein R3P38DRAFT_3235425 [Favolaschia claudopus]|uniref:Uncharacterized protein n=1 Tax=Favolaschia claudopus TaxID=2862362 RepID=A0AAV9ZEV7_9AGAR